MFLVEKNPNKNPTWAKKFHIAMIFCFRMNKELFRNKIIVL